MYGKFKEQFGGRNKYLCRYMYTEVKNLRLRICKSDFLITGVCHVFRCQKTITTNGMKAKRIAISEHQFIKTVE